MNRKVLLFLMFMCGVVLSVMVVAILWASDSVLLSFVLQWAIPALLILAFIFATGISVRHNLRTSNHFPGFSGLLPVHTAIEVIGKWGVRW